MYYIYNYIVGSIFYRPTEPLSTTKMIKNAGNTVFLVLLCSVRHFSF